MPGAEWCYSHHPDCAEQRSRNASRGGKSGGRGRSNKSNNELGEVKNQLQCLADAILDGHVNRADAAVCGQLLNVKLRALEQERRWREVEELAARLEAVESVLKDREKRQTG